MQSVLFIVTSLLLIKESYSVKKCLNYLPGNGVDVVGNKVTFPPTKDEPRTSKILTQYDSKGLDPFFNLAESFMNTVQKKSLPSIEGKLRHSNQHHYKIQFCNKLFF